MNRITEEKTSLEKKNARAAAEGQGGGGLKHRSLRNDVDNTLCTVSLPFEMDDLDFTSDHAADAATHLYRTQTASGNYGSSPSSSSSSSSTGISYFYQSGDGELVFLHSISFKPILAQANQNINLLPREITATVLEVEELKVTQSTRQKMPFMQHLPQQCRIMMVELDLREVVTHEVMIPFMDEINKRAKIRKKKENKKAVEKKEELTEKVKHEIFVEDMKERWRLRCEQEQATINELLSGPTPGEVHTPMIPSNHHVNNHYCNQPTNIPEDKEMILSSSPGDLSHSNGSGSMTGTPPNWSFARITANGYFPTLSEATTIPQNAAEGNSSNSCNGNNIIESSSPLSKSPQPQTHMTVLGGGVWGSQRSYANNNAPSSSPPSSSSSMLGTSPENSSSNNSTNSGKRSKGTPLFSNASGRSYR